MLTGYSVPEALILASAITALFTFIGNYLLLFPLKGTQPFLTEILKILIERVFVPISLMILMFCGLTGKRNFWFIGNYLLPFPQKGIEPFLAEILNILIERVFVPISLSRTGLVTALMILMFCGLAGKRNFWMLLRAIVRENREVPKDWGQPISFIFSAFKTKMIRLTLVTLTRFPGISLSRLATPLVFGEGKP